MLSNTIRFFLLMGVSGCGKTSVGKALAARLGWDFYDADDYHSPENKTKMAAGIPLTDEDRLPWLHTLHDLIAECLQKGSGGVLACSALKEGYRQILLGDNLGVQLIYLKGSYELIWQRMAGRTGHYMHPGMLRSQFETLEEPKEALVLDVSLSVDEIVEKILQSYGF